MTTGKDPFVGQALDLFVSDFEVTPDDLLLAARGGAARLRGARRRRQTAVVVAFAALLLFAGAAFAAKKYDLLPFLHTNDKNAARFSVSTGPTYHGAAPMALTCPTAREGRFICHVSGPMAGGTRLYQLGMRTDKAPVVTRQSMLDELDRAQGVSATEVAKVKSDLAAVDDRFIRVLATLSRIQTVSSGSGPSGPNGTERVPPRGVPAWVACRELTLATFQCRPLAALIGVDAGAPLYNLQRSPDWREVSEPAEDPNAFSRELERLLGRKPNAAETRFMVDFFTAAAHGTDSSGSAPTTGGEIATSTARSTALLAPQSLGVPTRNASAVAQPLPHRLPNGLARSRTRLFRVAFDVHSRHHTLYVYVGHRARLHVWTVVWVTTKP